MSVESPGSYEVYSGLNQLVSYGLAEQDRINGLSDEEEQKRQIHELVRELDATCPYKGERLSITGDKLYRLPWYAADAGLDGSLQEYDGDVVLQGGETEEGYSWGFSAEKVDVVCDGAVVASRYVLLHMVHTGETYPTDLIQVDDGNVHVTKVMTYFAVENSKISFLDGALAHNILELRQSEEELYADLDTILYDETRSLKSKLRKIHQLLTALEFSEQSPQKQHEVISYLNACKLLPVVPRICEVTYAAFNGGAGGESVMMLRMPILSLLHGFVLADHYGVGESDTQNGTDGITYAGKGVGVMMTVFYGDKAQTITVPLNQRVQVYDEKGTKRREPRNAKPLAEKALAAV